MNECFGEERAKRATASTGSDAWLTEKSRLEKKGKMILMAANKLAEAIVEPSRRVSVWLQSVHPTPSSWHKSKHTLTRSESTCTTQSVLHIRLHQASHSVSSYVSLDGLVQLRPEFLQLHKQLVNWGFRELLPQFELENGMPPPRTSLTRVNFQTFFFF